MAEEQPPAVPAPTQSSVTIGRSASGVQYWRIVVVGDDVAAAQAEAERINAELQTKYPSEGAAG